MCASIEYFVLHITFLTKESVTMALKLANLHSFMVVADNFFFLLMYIASFAVTLGNFDKKNLLN